MLHASEHSLFLDSQAGIQTGVGQRTAQYDNIAALGCAGAYLHRAALPVQSAKQHRY